MPSLRLVLFMSLPECSGGSSALPDASGDTADLLAAPGDPDVLLMLHSTPAPQELSGGLGSTCGFC